MNRARLLTGEFPKAIEDLGSILFHIERLRDESYPLYIRVQIALARAHLELGNAAEARRVLPGEFARGILFRDQSLTAVDAWIEHLEGNIRRRDALLIQLDHEVSGHLTIEFSRSISQMRSSMLSGEKTPTMRWGTDEV
jgi:hypothetical protein